MSTEHKGTLEVDHQRGVIYFHDETGTTRFRICGLPRPVPPADDDDVMLDVTHMHGTNWGYSS